MAANTAPSVSITSGGASSVPSAGDRGTFELGLFDTSTRPADLKVSATSSNPSVVPATGVTFSGVFGPLQANRTVTIVPVSGGTGTAVITLTVTDEFGATDTLPITVRVGGAAADTLSGTAGPDLLLGRGGADTLRGQAGIDLLGGGAGNDTLTGGTGADVFSAGSGTNTLTDFSVTDGDTKAS